MMLYHTGLSTPVFGLRREIDRLFEDTFGRGDGVNTWTPPVDVRETEKELRLDVEIPGIRPEDLEMTADNGVLTIRGEKRSELKEGDEQSRYHVVERSYGSFMRSFQLPQGLDESKIEADCNNGILSVHIPKTALPQPRKIQIGTGDTQRRMMSGTDTATGQKQERAAGSTFKTGTTGTETSSTKGGTSRSRETADAGTR